MDVLNDMNLKDCKICFLRGYVTWLIQPICLDPGESISRKRADEGSGGGLKWISI